MDNSFFNSNRTHGNFWLPCNNNTNTLQPQQCNGNVQYFRNHFDVNSVAAIHYTSQVHHRRRLPRYPPIIQMSPRVAKKFDNFSKNEHTLEHGAMQQENHRQISMIPFYGVAVKKEISPIVANDFENFSKSVEEENHWRRTTIPSYGVSNKTAPSSASNCTTNISFDDMHSIGGDLDEWHDIVQQYKLAEQRGIDDPTGVNQLVSTIHDTVINVDTFDDFHLSVEERAELFAIADGTCSVSERACSESKRDDIPQVVLNYEQNINFAPNMRKRKRKNCENLPVMPEPNLNCNLNQQYIVNSHKSQCNKVNKDCQTSNAGNSKRQTTTKNEKSFTCPICGKQFCRFGYFKRHIERQHHQNFYNDGGNSAERVI
uniref:C2H2-type domain-containing protein n=1 Tax=Glossina palpalis gambiensis TaxID=67801 RepID=A0A1B0AMZ9_9MUSC